MRSLSLEAGGPIHVAEWGQGEPALVLVHGLAGSHLNWMAVAPRLAEWGRVLAPDLPGFGLSPLAGRSSSLAAERTVLHRVLRLLTPSPVILVGNSMGGLLALAEAGLHPERVAGLVLVDPAVPVPWRERPQRLVTAAFAAYTVRPLGRRLVQRYLDRNRVEGIVDGAFGLCTAHPERIPAEVRQAHIDLERVRESRRPENDRAFVEAGGSIVINNLRPGAFNHLLDRVVAPTLVIHGERDALVRVGAARALARRRPDWEVTILQDAGHLPMLEAPERFLCVIETWLRRHAVELRLTRLESGRAAS